MPSVADIVASINELPPEEHAAFAAALQNDGGAVVKAARSKMYSAALKDGEARGKDAGTKAAEAAAQERITALETELAEVKAKTPDAAAIETRVRAQLQPKLEKAERERDDERSKRLTGDADRVFGDVLGALRTKDDAGLKLKEGWTPLVQAAYRDRVRPAEDGSIRVLQLGSEIAYEAATPADAARLLAADVRKQFAQQYPDSIESSATGGGGRTAGGHGGAAVTVQKIAEQKRAAGAVPGF